MKTYGYIYLHKNKINGHCYVGQSTQEPARRFRHEDPTYPAYKNCQVFYKALMKYTWSGFETIILAHADSQMELNLLEERYMKEYNSLQPNGYNIKPISEGRGKQAESTKKLMSEKRKQYIAIHGSTPFGPPKNLHKNINGIECKQCTSCNLWKTLNCFGKYADTWDKLNRKCKNCHNEYRRQYKYQGLSKEDWKKSYLNRQNKKAPA